MEQLLLHLLGDYLTQSDWMAQNKTKHSWPAFCHAMVYSMPFLLLSTHILALACIFGTHFLIDRFRLARYVVWAKNWLGPAKAWYYDPTWCAVVTDKNPGNCRRICKQPTPPFEHCDATGYPPERPAWMAVWLLIIADNTMHLAINYSALRWL